MALTVNEIKSQFLDMVVEDPAMISVLHQVWDLAKSNLDLLVLGESGVGKEVIARAIHRLSDRSQGAFVAINLAAIPESMMESELFGHEKGAFTGAGDRHIGYFEQADRGILFLDEIGDFPLKLQPKLLRTLQNKIFYRLGGTTAVHSDTRIMAATDKNLIDLVRRGEFAKTLYFRFQVCLKVPPLRERKEDIPALVKRFLQAYNLKHSKNLVISPDALAYLKQHPLPGNVRQLLSGLESAIVRASPRQQHLTSEDLRPLMADWESWPVPSVNDALFSDLDRLTLSQISEVMIERRLEKYNGNKSKAARSLGISRETLRTTIKKYGIRIKHQGTLTH